MTSATTLAGFIHRFEPARVEPARTLLLLHGTGGDERSMDSLGRMLDPDAARLSPRGQVLEGEMPRYFRRIREGVFDVEDLKLRTGHLAEFIDAATAQYRLDPARVVAVGFSNGANIAASLMLLRPGLLRAAALFRPMVPFEPDPGTTGLSGTDVFIGAGRTDPIAPPAGAERLSAMLESAGARVTLDWEPGGHGFGPGQAERAREWLQGL